MFSIPAFLTVVLLHHVAGFDQGRVTATGLAFCMDLVAMFFTGEANGNPVIKTLSMCNPAMGFVDPGQEGTAGNSGHSGLALDLIRHFLIRLPILFLIRFRLTPYCFDWPLCFLTYKARALYRFGTLLPRGRCYQSRQRL